ncbi:hypothetical protein FEI13_07170 [Halomonas urmiana]|uniref:Uncharacterized protein n=1 Tax=Halomonas urmiana TaxID=490901 RepID=A0A5R8MIB8_9GAMM|nr:hypothetical protein [Halomonas urmiana]TLF51721.1 hypothetical protein FEI13_07170 [Halomonas urmiana]
MSHKFIEVITNYPTTEKDYPLLLHIDQIVQIRPEIEAENEPLHEPVAVVTLTSGETLILKNTYQRLIQGLDEVHMVFRP